MWISVNKSANKIHVNVTPQMVGLYSEVLGRLDKAKKNLIIEEWMMAASVTDGEISGLTARV